MKTYGLEYYWAVFVIIIRERCQSQAVWREVVVRGEGRCHAQGCINTKPEPYVAFLW